MDKTFEDLIKEEAYRIFLWRTQFEPPFPGDELSDYYEALENIKEEQEAKSLDISPITVNRVKNLI